MRISAGVQTCALPIYPLTIVLVERTVASKSSTSQLDSKGQFGLIPPTTGALALFGESDATFGGKRGFAGTGTAGQPNALPGAPSVTVATVYPTGTMPVHGQKPVTLNPAAELPQHQAHLRPPPPTP